MKWLLPITLLALNAFADELSDRTEYHSEGSPHYCVIAATDFRVSLEMRSSRDDALLQTIVVPSGYMPPSFEAMDVVLDDTLEFVVKTRDGGTGLAETRLSLYGLIRGRIRFLGDFALDRISESWPEPTRQERLIGHVYFPETNKLNYDYTQVLTENGKTTTNVASAIYSYDPKTMTFKTKKITIKPVKPRRKPRR